MLQIPGMGRCHLPARSLVGPQAVADQVLAASGYTGTTKVCRPGFGDTDTCASARLLGGLHWAPWPGLEGPELRAGPIQSLWGHRWEHVLPCVPVLVEPLADCGWEGMGPVTGHFRTHSRGKVCVWSPRHGWEYLLPGLGAEMLPAEPVPDGAVLGSAAGTSLGGSAVWAEPTFPGLLGVGLHQTPQPAQRHSVCKWAPSQPLSRDTRGHLTQPSLGGPPADSLASTPPGVANHCDSRGSCLVHEIPA